MDIFVNNKKFGVLRVVKLFSVINGRHLSMLTAEGLNLLLFSHLMGWSYGAFANIIQLYEVYRNDDHSTCLLRQT